MLKHEGHLKQRELTFLLGALSFLSLPSRLLLFLLFFHSITCFHYVLQLQQFFCFFFSCALTLQLAFTLCIGFDITYSSLLFCCCPSKLDIFVVLNSFCFIHCCSEAFFHFWSFGVICFCFFIQPQHHHRFEDFISLITIPRLFSFFVCNLFFQGSICFCFYNTFL